MWTRTVGVLLMAGCAVAQTPAASPAQSSSTQTSSEKPSAAQAVPATSASSAASPAAAVRPASSSLLTIPSGTKVPLALKQAISTRNAKEGDPVYCETTFPFVVDDRIVIPAGTYVQ